MHTTEKLMGERDRAAGHIEDRAVTPRIHGWVDAGLEAERDLPEVQFLRHQFEQLRRALDRYIPIKTGS
jgi:hypothetical protein